MQTLIVRKKGSTVAVVAVAVVFGRARGYVRTYVRSFLTYVSEPSCPWRLSSLGGLGASVFYVRTYCAKRSGTSCARVSKRTSAVFCTRDWACSCRDFCARAEAERWRYVAIINVTADDYSEDESADDFACKLLLPTLRPRKQLRTHVRAHTSRTQLCGQ